jgi:hypothetical protein
MDTALDAMDLAQLKVQAESQAQHMIFEPLPTADEPARLLGGMHCEPASPSERVEQAVVNSIKRGYLMLDYDDSFSPYEKKEITALYESWQAGDPRDYWDNS